MNRHLRILDFALFELAGRPARLVAVLVVYSLLVFVSASLLLYVEGMRGESRRLLADSPDLLVQRLAGGRHDPIPVERAEAIRSIRAVRAVEPRIWGYVYDPPSGATLTLWGADPVLLASVNLTEGRMPEGEGECAVGEGLAAVRLLEVGDRFPLRASDDRLYAPRLVGVFSAESAILTNDLIVMPSADAARVFALAEDRATDLAVFLSNAAEADTVARKIQETWADARVITRAQLRATYDAVFDWRAGVWASALLLVIAAFAVLVWDAASGLSSEESRMLGLLKAVGWSNGEVMELRVWQGAAVSLASTLSGLTLAMIHIVLFDGWMVGWAIKGWSVLYPTFPLEPSLDSYTLLLCVLFSALPYTAASLLPACRAAVTDPDAAMRA